MAFRVVTRADHLRSRVEHEIRTIYYERFAARLRSFPSILVADFSDRGTADCAAGIRLGAEALFSETYLDRPAEAALERRFGRAVDRQDIVEVCHLVARKPGLSLGFVVHIIAFAERIGAEWAIFTATRPLRMLLRKAGLTMTELARAEPVAVANASEWGRYYDYDPRVMVVNRDSAARGRRNVFGVATCDHHPHA